MREGLLFAVSLDNSGRVERWLAVIGGGALGVLLAVVLSGLVARALFLGQIPRLARSIIGLLGGVAAGWLVYYLLLSGRGWGDGPGGPNTGRPGTSSGITDNQSSSAKNETESPGQPTDKGTIRVEVLGNAPLKKIAGSKFDEERRYRMEGNKGPELLTLPDLKKRIEERLEQKPPLRVLEVVIYADSPSTKNSYVVDLVNWARELRTEGQEKLRVDRITRSRKASVP